VALFSKSMVPNGNGFQIAAFILTHSHHRAPFKFIAHIRTTYTSVREFAPGSSAPLVSYLEHETRALVLRLRPAARLVCIIPPAVILC
jgi:hypothetical protein